MSTLVQNVAKVKSAYNALSASIEAKGVSVPAGTKLTGMPALVDQIQTGGAVEPNTSKITLHSDDSTHIDVNRIIVADTSQMTSFDGFFAEDKKLTSVSFPADFAPNAINMNSFFYECNSIKNINIPPNFAPNATKFNKFCYSCSSLSSFEYSEDFGQKAESVSQFFWNCNLSSVIIPPNFADVEYASDIVGNCRNLTSITFPSNFGHKIRSSWDFVHMFNYCDNLTEIYGDLALSVDFAIENNNVSHDSLIRVLNSIPTVTESRSLKLGNTNIAKLTDEEKKIATDKGWNLIN